MTGEGSGPAEPAPPEPAPPRYTTAPFPRYRYIPGRAPHPRRDPRGHSWGAPEPRAQAIDPEAWSVSSLYLRGIDLFNHAYWWESHEALEALWRGTASGSPAAELLQALIQLAAAEIKHFSAMPGAATKLWGRARERLLGVPSPYLGLDVRALVVEVEARLAGTRTTPLVLRLESP